jgi:adhesin/invasin
MPARSDQDGRVYAWGWGYTAGQGEKNFALRANQVLLSDGSPLTNVVQISVGTNYSLALTSNGEVYGWGPTMTIKLEPKSHQAA